MKYYRALSLSVQALLVVQTWAQFRNWDEHQINTSISALVRDTVYLDGGDILWSPGFEDGMYGMPVNHGNPQGLVLTYNLSIPFSATSNVTGILLQAPLSKARQADFSDGGMLANDAEFFLYGGAAFSNVQQNAPLDKAAVIEYQAYQYGPDKPLWEPAFHYLELPEGMTRYIAYGGAANAPSENKAWYFSGLTSSTRGPILKNWNATTRAANISNTLISVDMSEQLDEKWSNDTLPTQVQGRANPEVVWVPVGDQGILVVLGGVVYPEWINAERKSENETASMAESAEFMRVIDIYDIANDKWYKQPTQDGAPSARTRGCAAVAPASDYSSFNIFYYGGYDGLHPQEDFYDEVWVLSIPSFTWTRINNGTSIHARSGHKCFLPYPDQMMVFGGYTALPGEGIPCLDQGPVVIFNLTSGEWMDSYDPAKYGDYGVHEKVQAVIGGNPSGGATATKPIPSGWATNALAEVFATPYPQKKITTYWPYNPAVATERPPPPDHHPGSALPSWFGPVLGVVLGLALVTGIVVLFCLWRRRRIFKNRFSEPGAEDAGLRILAWMRGQPPSNKAPTVTTMEDSLSSPDMREAATLVLTCSVSTPAGPPPPQEMADTQVTQLVELDPDATRVELHDTGLTPLDIYRRYSHWLHVRNGVLPSPSDSTISTSGYSQSPVSPVHRDYSGGMPRIDSPPLGISVPVVNPSRSPPPPVPELSENDAEPLKPIPETSNPTSPTEGQEKIGAEEAAKTVPVEQGDVVLPPTAMEVQGEDHSLAKKTPSSPRKSVFQEKEDDLGKFG